MMMMMSSMGETVSPNSPKMNIMQKIVTYGELSSYLCS
jgi:hypothetical protein